MALEIRAREGIPVRQALSRLVVKGTDLDPDFLDLVKEELNVKEVITAPGDVLAVELDTKITPELKLEGICRDLTRHINDRRKKMGLSFKDKIDLYIETPDPEIQACIDQFKARLMMAVQADAITDVIEQDTNIEKMEIRGSPVKFIIKRKWFLFLIIEIYDFIRDQGY